MIKSQLFKSPPSEFRGVPFWSINDKLDPNEITRQIALLDEGGYGGVFFHAREGLAAPFLGGEWFEAFKSAVKESKKRGMYVWIYDELWWPSGFAGGMIPALGPKYRAKALMMIASERAFGGEEIIANFKCKLNSKGIPCEYEIAEPDEEGGDYIYLSFATYVASLGETWFNGFSYVDLLDPEVVKKFLEVAYTPYVDRFKDEIGDDIPGVFTDEPNISSSRRRISRLFGNQEPIPPRGPRFLPFFIPWTDKLIKKFKEIHGYNIVDKLPELFFDVGNYMKTRYDFWKTITILFLKAFSKQIYEWCDKHGLKFTGHYLAEDKLLSQLLCGGAVMPHYEYQHIPGIDHLGMNIWNTLLTAKQVSSAANQLGKERVLCETYGCTGNYPSFADRKWIGDWLYVMGVNLLNHHLVPYSMRGRRKRDYGLNFHWSQPWWKYNRIIEDYFARLSYILSRGKRVVNVLVIHPIASAWTAYSPLNPSKVMELDDYLTRLLRALLSAHIDFDLGDEILMEKYGKVENGKLRVGRMLYDAIIIPPSITLSNSTIRLLRGFADSGGKILAVNPTPYLVDGRPSDLIKEILNKAKIVSKIDSATVKEALKDVPRPIKIEGDEKGDILYHLRRDEESDALILFLTNISRERAHNITLTLNGSFIVENWDPISGGQKPYPSKIKNGCSVWDVRLEPVGSALFILRAGTPETEIPPEKKVKICEIPITGSWTIKKLNLNALVLDYCRCRVKGAWSDLMPVWKAQDTIVQNGLGTKFSLRFEFESEIDFRDKRAYLVVENPERFKIRVNGIEVESKAEGYWIDWNFPMIDVSQMLSKGLNVIELDGIIGIEPELENIYLLGDFAVKAGAKGACKLIEEPASIELGDLCQMGYPFYAGEIELSKSVNIDVPENTRVFLHLEELNSSLAVVYVNDVEAGKAILPPYEVEITSAVKPGENKIKILLVGTLRNVLGPLHHKGVDPPFISQETFRDLRNWTDEYVLRPFGVKCVKISMFK